MRVAPCRRWACFRSASTSSHSRRPISSRSSGVTSAWRGRSGSSRDKASSSGCVRDTEKQHQNRRPHSLSTGVRISGTFAHVGDAPNPAVLGRSQFARSRTSRGRAARRARGRRPFPSPTVPSGLSGLEQNGERQQGRTGPVISLAQRSEAGRNEAGSTHQREGAHTHPLAGSAAGSGSTLPRARPISVRPWPSPGQSLTKKNGAGGG